MPTCPRYLSSASAARLRRTVALAAVAFATLATLVAGAARADDQAEAHFWEK